jgi:hypothetical protein
MARRLSACESESPIAPPSARACLTTLCLTAVRGAVVLGRVRYRVWRRQTSCR